MLTRLKFVYLLIIEVTYVYIVSSMLFSHNLIIMFQTNIIEQ